MISSSWAQSPSPHLAFVKSAVLPGWGELSMGSKTGYIFMGMEALAWFSKLYCEEEEDLKRLKSFNYAVKYAHIDPDLDYEDDYYYHLSKFNNSGFEPGGYNAYIVEQSEYQSNPQQYLEDNLYPEEYYWSWDSDDNRVKYGKTRKKASDFSDYAKAITGTIVVNHLISGINAFRIARKMRKVDVTFSFDLDLNPRIECRYTF
jgi:hypothetical protein